jgi:hypothetical protein
VLAWLTFRLIEKPIRFGKHSQAKTITLFVLMVVVGYVGYSCFKRDGLMNQKMRALNAKKNIQVINIAILPI